MPTIMLPDGLITGSRGNGETIQEPTNQAVDWLFKDQSPETLSEKIGVDRHMTVVTSGESKMRNSRSPEVNGSVNFVRKITKQAFVDAVTSEAPQLDGLDRDHLECIVWVSSLEDDSVVRFVGANPPGKPAMLYGHPVRSMHVWRYLTSS